MDDLAGRPFGLLVIFRAWKDTLAVFEACIRTVVVGLALAAVGFAGHVSRDGWADLTKDLWQTALDSLIPVLIVGAGIFIWNFWLAPFLVVLDLVKQQAAISPAYSANIASPPDPIDWGPWRIRQFLTVYEFAKILAKADPAKQALPSSASGYARALLEAISRGEIEYRKRFLRDWQGHSHEDPPRFDTEMARDSAIAWANDHQFAVDHIL
jgi:hypothetical protein